MIGILALQGCVEPHAIHLRALGAEIRYVRTRDDLENLHGLILPGGESTTMLKLLHQFGLWEALPPLAEKIPFWGICAGAILMARTVENPQQPSLNILDIAVKRNAYGRQLESFQGAVEVDGNEEAAVFIRAPKFLRWGPEVQVAGFIGEEAVFLKSGRHMVTAFHPELTESGWCHRRFLAL